MNHFRPRRIHLQRVKGWRKPDNTVVVSRPSKWGNPFRADTQSSPAECVTRYKRWLRLTPDGIAVAAAAKHALKGKNLACWCAPGQPCHADVLLEVANS